jgi:hypothetical protein
MNGVGGTFRTAGRTVGRGRPECRLVRTAGGIRRSSYATLAVGATTLALVALLGVSVLVARQGGGSGDQLLAGAAASRSGADGDGDPGSSGGRAAAGRRTAGGAGAAGASSARDGTGVPNGSSSPGGPGAGGSPRAAGAGSGAGPGSGAGLTGAGSGSGSGAARGSDSGAGGTGSGSGSGSGAGSAPGSSGTGAAGSGAGTVASSSDGSPTTMSARTAKPGDWVLRVESRAQGVLLADDSGDTRVHAGQATSEGVQRFDAAGGPGLGLFGAYTTRVNTQGRHLTELDLRGEPGRRFVSAAPVLDVPSTWRPGDRWAWRLAAEDGRTTVEATSSVVGREVVTLPDGRTEVETVRVDSTFVLGGDRSVTVTRKLWFSPSLGMPVRTIERSTGTDAGGRAVDRDVVIQLTATEPGPAPAGGVVPKP